MICANGSSILYLPQEVDERLIKQKLYEEIKVRQIEPPTPARLDRLLNSAHRQFEIQLCTSVMEQLPETCLQELDALTGPQEDSYILNPKEIRLNQLKEEAGPVGLKSLSAELCKLEIIREVGVPDKLLEHLCDPIVERYRLRVETETLTELRRHPDPIRYMLLAAFCWLRSQEIIDNVVELFVQLVLRMERRSKNRVSAEVVAQAQSNDNHDKILCQIAMASLAEPEGLVKDVIYPIADEEKLEQLIDRLGDDSGTFRERQMVRLRSAYIHHYRRMLPSLVKAIEFCATGSHLKPLLDALELLKDYADKPNQVPYPTDINIPMEGVLSPGWQEVVMKTGSDGSPEIDRLAYEIVVLQTMREKLRCKELWVVGADRYRNPDDDLPQDFESNREEYYQDLQQPLDAEAFIAKIQADMTQVLEALNRGIPSNSKVSILEKRGGWIHLTPLEEQPEPEHLRKLKEEINRRWSIISLLDILKETEFRLQFTKHFRSTGNRETLEVTEVRKRLLLCLYAMGTNLGTKRVAHGEHGVSYTDLRYVRRKFLSKAALRQAITDVADAIFRVRLPYIWGDATTACASDSKQFGTWDQNLLTEWHNRYKKKRCDDLLAY